MTDIRHGSPFASDEAHLCRCDDWDDVCTSVVTTVAAAEEIDECDLPPLGEAVDPDALTELFADRPEGDGRHGGVVSFEYASHEVEVTADGWVLVRD